MPSGWTIIGGTPDDLRGVLYNPVRFKDVVYKKVSDAGAALDNVYYDKNKKKSYLLVHVPLLNADAIFEALDKSFETQFERLYAVEELD